MNRADTPTARDLDITNASHGLSDGNCQRVRHFAGSAIPVSAIAR